MNIGTDLLYSVYAAPKRSCSSGSSTLFSSNTWASMYSGVQMKAIDTEWRMKPIPNNPMNTPVTIGFRIQR